MDNQHGFRGVTRANGLAMPMTTDALLVAGLFVLIWAAILVPPAANAHASRQAEFLGSLRDPGGVGSDAAPRQQVALSPLARRRYILGGLLVAMAATLVLGLLPTFRLVLVVHLLLVDSFLAYVGFLVLLRDREARRRRVAVEHGPVEMRRDDVEVGPEPEWTPRLGGVTVAAPRAAVATLANSA